MLAARFSMARGGGGVGVGVGRRVNVHDVHRVQHMHRVQHVHDVHRVHRVHRLQVHHIHHNIYKSNHKFNGKRMNSLLFFSRRSCSSATPSPTPSPTPIATPSLLHSLITGYVTLLGANFISNMMIHPTQKMDYGVLNYLYPDDREVSEYVSVWCSV